MSAFTESVEDAALGWLESLGWTRRHFSGGSTAIAAPRLGSGR
jgi:hypothetical protein